VLLADEGEITANEEGRLGQAFLRHDDYEEERANNNSKQQDMLLRKLYQLQGLRLRLGYGMI
tara:strand:- start:230 stop:415 length:186 start_codon:yes stop_codon:yes gene_type:complete